MSSPPLWALFFFFVAFQGAKKRKSVGDAGGAAPTKNYAEPGLGRRDRFGAAHKSVLAPLPSPLPKTSRTYTNLRAPNLSLVSIDSLRINSGRTQTEHLCFFNTGAGGKYVDWCHSTAEHLCFFQHWCGNCDALCLNSLGLIVVN